jgi:hypothetical protein
MALKYRQLYEEVLGQPAIAAVPAPRLDSSNIDARGA